MVQPLYYWYFQKRNRKSEMKFEDEHSSVLSSLLKKRFSCRGFLPDPVPREIQSRILDMAQHSASWCNSQPWQVHITEGDATERFRRVMLESSRPDECRPDFEWPRAYQGVYQERRRECGRALYESVGIARGDKEGATKQASENFRLFGAPHVAVITADAELGPYGAVDCGGYVACFLLAAASMGVATVAQAALAARPQRIRDFFDLGQDRKVVCGISFGFPDLNHPANGFRTTRASVASAVSWTSV